MVPSLQLFTAFRTLVPSTPLLLGVHLQISNGGVIFLRLYKLTLAASFPAFLYPLLLPPCLSFKCVIQILGKGCEFCNLAVPP